MNIDLSKQQLLEDILINHDKSLQRFIYTLTRRDEFAMEEIYQNTMLMALLGLRKLKKSDKILSWLFSIAKTEAKRYYHKNNNYFVHEIILENENNEDYISENKIDDFTKVIEDNDLLITVLNHFSNKERQIFLLHYYYDISFKEISEILNINYNSIRSIHIRGLNKLKKFCEAEVKLDE